MDPLSVWNVGSKAFIGGTNAFYALKDVLSVLVPGSVVLAELLYVFVLHPSHAAAPILMPWLSHLSTIQSILLSLLAISAAYVVGSLSRQVAFLLLSFSSVRGSVADIFEEVKRLDAEKVSPDSRSVAPGSSPLLDKIFEAHPLLRAPATERQRGDDGSQSSRPGQSLLLGGHARSRGDAVDYTIYAYCKLWLRTYSPRLSIDHIEIEINVIAASLVPTFLMAVLVLAAADSTSISLRAFVCLIVGLSLWIFTSAAVNLRQRERVEAVRNVCFDYMMRSSATKLARTAETDSDAT